MSKAGALFSYSIGKKLIMALTGLFLIVFLLEHLIGNFLLLVGPVEFAEYAYFMGHNPLIRIAEVGLFAFIIFHVVDGLWLWSKNSKARSQGYAVKGGRHNASWFSRNMHWTGVVILTFMILHLISFWALGRLDINVDMGAEESVYAAEVTSMIQAASPEDAERMTEISHELMLSKKIESHFQVWWYSLIYILAMAFVGFHLNHGFQSAFQSLGIDHSKFKPVIKATGTFIAILLPAGFAAIAMYFFLAPFV